MQQSGCTWLFFFDLVIFMIDCTLKLVGFHRHSDSVIILLTNELALGGPNSDQGLHLKTDSNCCSKQTYLNADTDYRIDQNATVVKHSWLH